MESGNPKKTTDNCLWERGTGENQCGTSGILRKALIQDVFKDQKGLDDLG